MLRPAMSQILKPGESYYEFVVAVARKARQIASEAEENHVMLDEKPVTMAVNMFASGELKLSDSHVSVEPQEPEAAEEQPAAEAEPQPEEAQTAPEEE